MYALQFSSHCFPMSVQFLGSSTFINCTTSVNKSNPLLLNRINVPFHSWHSVISLGKLQCVPSDMIQKAISSALPRVKVINSNISMNARSWPSSSKPISKCLSVESQYKSSLTIEWAQCHQLVTNCSVNLRKKNTRPTCRFRHQWWRIARHKPR